MDTRTNMTTQIDPARRQVLGAAGAAGLAAMMPLALTACGGTRNEPSSLRFVNATLGFGNLTAQSDSTQLAVLAAGSATGFVGVDNRSQTLRFKVDGTTLLEQGGFSPKARAHWTALLFSSGGALQLSLYEENESAPGSGECKVRVFNAGNNGTLDVFLATASADINTVPPVVGAVGEAQFSGYAQITSGSRRLLLASTGDRTDARLDVPAVDFPSNGVVTLVVMPTRSARLLQAVVLVHGGDSLSQANPLGRLRFVNSLDTAASPVVDGASALGVLPQFGVSTLLSVSTGSHSVGFGINGSTTVQPRNVVAASDASCVLWGTAAAPQLAFLDDDDSRASVSTQVKLRLANFASGVTSATLLVDLSANGVSAAAGTASGYTQANVAQHQLNVNASNGTSLGALTNQNLLTDAVYTLFVLGSAANPQLVLRRDR